MGDYKKWYQGTTQEAYDKFHKASCEFWSQAFDAIFDAIDTAFGWIPRLIRKLIKNMRA